MAISDSLDMGSLFITDQLCFTHALYKNIALMSTKKLPGNTDRCIANNFI